MNIHRIVYNLKSNLSVTGYYRGPYIDYFKSKKISYVYSDVGLSIMKDRPIDDDLLTSNLRFVLSNGALRILSALSDTQQVDEHDMQLLSDLTQITASEVASDYSVRFGQIRFGDQLMSTETAFRVCLIELLEEAFIQKKLTKNFLTSLIQNVDGQPN